MKNDDQIYIGEVLKKWRERLNLTQQELAARINMDRTYISNLEREIQQPSLQTIFMIAKGLGISASILVREIEECHLKKMIFVSRGMNSIYVH